MKIQFDKVESLPKHVLNAQKIKLAFSIMPEEMKSLVDFVHIGNELPAKSRFERPVILSSKRLRVLDRGMSEFHIIREIYIELAQRGSGHHSTLRSRKLNRLNPGQRKDLETLVEPLISEYFKSRGILG